MLKEYKIKGYANEAATLAKEAIKRGIFGGVLRSTNECMRYDGLKMLFEPMIEASILSLEAGGTHEQAREAAEHAYYRECEGEKA